MSLNLGDLLQIYPEDTQTSIINTRYSFTPLGYGTSPGFVTITEPRGSGTANSITSILTSAGIGSQARYGANSFIGLNTSNILQSIISYYDNNIFQKIEYNTIGVFRPTQAALPVTIAPGYSTLEILSTDLIINIPGSSMQQEYLDQVTTWKVSLAQEIETYRNRGPGWDGYDASPISLTAIEDAREFIGALPEDIRAPSRLLKKSLLILRIVVPWSGGWGWRCAATTRFAAAFSAT
jgi:hypothetical protein